MKRHLFSTAALVSALSLSALGEESAESTRKVVSVNPAHFIKESLLKEITTEERELADGTKALCYIITTKSMPHEHEMGPWSPKTITDGEDQGGIWFEGGKVYNVDGAFVKNIAEFYDDPEWKLYREDGSVIITESKEAFLAAARPDVAEEYNNHVVEGKAEWFDEMVTTYVIPVTPIYQDESTRFGHGAIGVAFNGVHFDPPAPTEAILRAHTLAPLDQSGGHLNPFEGYHYHAVMGTTKEIAQEDGHAPQIGYALDGFPIFAQLDEDGNASEDLDSCGGHYDEVRGYHYHAGAAGDNQVFKAFRGIPGTYTATQLDWTQGADGAGGHPGQRGAGGPPPGAPPRGEGRPPHGPPPGERPPGAPAPEGQASNASSPHSHDGVHSHTHEEEDSSH